MKKFKSNSHTHSLLIVAILIVVLFAIQIFSINSYSKENEEYNKLLAKKDELVRSNSVLKSEVFKLGSLSYIEEKSKELGFVKPEMLFLKSLSLASL